MGLQDLWEWTSGSLLRNVNMVSRTGRIFKQIDRLLLVYHLCFKCDITDGCLAFLNLNVWFYWWTIHSVISHGMSWKHWTSKCADCINTCACRTQMLPLVGTVTIVITRVGLRLCDHVCLFVCLSVCLCTGYLQSLSLDSWIDGLLEG